MNITEVYIQIIYYEYTLNFIIIYAYAIQIYAT